jgi:glycosyltransferase involved in cell wall biosynthesis
MFICCLRVSHTPLKDFFMENKVFKPVQEDLISIVLTYFNRKKFIIDQLKSIISQTYKNWELIIIDDYSTDGSEEIIQKFIKDNSDRKITYIKNKTNLGLAKNFEKGLGFTAGRYVAVCDSDDVWFRDKLEKELKILKSGNFGMVYSDLVVVDENLKTIKKSFIKNCLSFFSNQKNDTFWELIDDNHITAPTILFRAELKDKLIPFSKYGLQDYWIAILASMCIKIGFLSQPTVYYRQHLGNMVGASRLSVSKLIFGDKNDFLDRHLQMKKDSLLFLYDLGNVQWIKDKYKNAISKKIGKTNILVECLSQIKNNDLKIWENLKALFRLKAYREIIQIIYFRFGP